MYKSMVLPCFDYGDILCQGTNGKDSKKLKELHNPGSQIYFGHRNLFDEMQCESKVAKLDNRRSQHVYNFMFK